ncbi:16S rRNA (cytosine(1402)-N(4))-methyltransferase RsmH [Calidifontibacter sp. DB0510]|uniref:Ribosomal RNA small subunit methyltransferase H n=1 Tax=Metallococcus carri TaxID=1656884 RepID=A0A967EEV9_9MICO|nr:16S rRNA (cytosine(1402)-N(4))-methyltransferase RsmH [Metallococcus carri]NHN56041.1 16S rRNA (cytosine(1402)-N(4))-methyltransferase RsmH [Metallococcus carri]NOP37502.1 16S rRNA (cytosine(1402)-N(4))-methyltransferase RsmH [Calidifontibacter sp. DB2511S]
MNQTDGSAATRHAPVLRDRITDLLAPALQRAGAVAVDGTLGMGGHAEALLERCPQAIVVGVDRDQEALRLAGERLARFGDRFRPLHATYDRAFDLLAEDGIATVDAVLFDLGVSSLQLDETERGFSYSRTAPLDMRMDQSEGVTAAEVVNSYDERELERILREYGEERFARRVAAAIVRARPLHTSEELMTVLRSAVPAASQRTGGHPGKRTFQALRIEVNGELDGWRAALPAALDALAEWGRIAVLSYHSLEDRITKTELAARSRSTAPPDLPVELPEHRPTFRLLTRGAETPSDAEMTDNPRAASARLRAAERVRS